MRDVAAVPARIVPSEDNHRARERWLAPDENGVSAEVPRQGRYPDGAMADVILWTLTASRPWSDRRAAVGCCARPTGPGAYWLAGRGVGLLPVRYFVGACGGPGISSGPAPVRQESAAVIGDRPLRFSASRRRRRGRPLPGPLQYYDAGSTSIASRRCCRRGRVREDHRRRAGLGDRPARGRAHANAIAVRVWNGERRCAWLREPSHRAVLFHTALSGGLRSLRRVPEADDLRGSAPALSRTEAGPPVSQFCNAVPVSGMSSPCSRMYP